MEGDPHSRDCCDRVDSEADVKIGKIVLGGVGALLIIGVTLVAADGGGRTTSDDVTAPGVSGAATAPDSTGATATVQSAADAGAIPLPSPAPGVTLNPRFIRPGEKSERVLKVQTRLKELGYDPGPLDSKFGPATQNAVWAFQRVNGLLPDAIVGDKTTAAMADPKPPVPMRPDGPPNRVEVSIKNQLLIAYRDNLPVVISHISSGSEIAFCENGICGDAVTPRGDYHVILKIDGWEHGPLGAMFNSVYFWPAYAIHGATSVPDVGLSHGCVRIPMHIAEYFPSLVDQGEPVMITE
jgi:hypothetical protein